MRLNTPFRRLSAWAVVFVSVAAIHEARAQEPKAKTKVAVASDASATNNKIVTKGISDVGKSTSDEFLLRIGGFIGGGDGSYNANPVVLGGSLDIRAAKYFGAEIYAFYGTYLTNNVIWPNHRDQSGGLFSLKTQLPFSTGPITWTPKLGGGTGSWNAGYQNFQGPFLQAGVEAEFWKLGVHADYYRGIGGSVTQTTVLTLQADMGPSSFSSTSDNGTKFEQYRAGTYYKIAPHMRLGVDVIQSHWVGVAHTQVIVPFELDF